MNKLDRYDIRILSELQRRANISNGELAELISLSPNACARRVKQLESSGLIKHKIALLDRQALGLNLTAFVMIGMDKNTPDRFEGFQRSILNCDSVIECSHVAGMDCDYQLKLVLKDIDHYQEFLLTTLSRIEGVVLIRSSFVLRQIKDSTVLPLEHL